MDAVPIAPSQDESVLLQRNGAGNVRLAEQLGWLGLGTHLRDRACA